MSPDIVVYSLDGCSHCDMLFMFLEQRGFKYTKIKIPDDMPREEFINAFPAARGFPHTLINGEEFDDPYFTLESGIF